MARIFKLVSAADLEMIQVTPFALGKAKIVYSLSLSECNNRVKDYQAIL